MRLDRILLLAAALIGPARAIDLPAVLSHEPDASITTAQQRIDSTILGQRDDQYRIVRRIYIVDHDQLAAGALAVLSGDGVHPQHALFTVPHPAAPPGGAVNREYTLDGPGERLYVKFGFFDQAGIATNTVVVLSMADGHELFRRAFPAKERIDHAVFLQPPQGEGRLLLLMNDGTRQHLAAVDTATGTLAEVPIDGHELIWLHPVPASERVLCDTPDGVASLDIATGAFAQLASFRKCEVIYAMLADHRAALLLRRELGDSARVTCHRLDFASGAVTQLPGSFSLQGDPDVVATDERLVYLRSVAYPADAQGARKRVETFIAIDAAKGAAHRVEASRVPRAAPAAR